MRDPDKVGWMINRGTYVPPEPFDRLAAGIEQVRLIATNPLWRDLPDVTRANLLRFVKESIDLLQAASSGGGSPNSQG